MAGPPFPHHSHFPGATVSIAIVVGFAPPNPTHTVKQHDTTPGSLRPTPRDGPGTARPHMAAVAPVAAVDRLTSDGASDSWHANKKSTENLFVTVCNGDLLCVRSGLLKVV